MQTFEKYAQELVKAHNADQVVVTYSRAKRFSKV